MIIASNLTDRETLSLTDSLPLDRIEALLEEISDLKEQVEAEQEENIRLEGEIRIYLDERDKYMDEVDELKDEIKRLNDDLSPFRFVEYTVSGHFASAIINDDWTGLADEDEDDLRKFLDNSEGEFWATKDGEEEASFAKCEVTGLMSSCVTILLAVRKS